MAGREKKAPGPTMILGFRTGRSTQPGGCPVRSFFSMQILISQGRSVVAPEQHRDCSTAIAVRRPAKPQVLKKFGLAACGQGEEIDWNKRPGRAAPIG